MKKRRGLTKLGTLAFCVGMIKFKDRHYYFRWLHPATLIMYAVSVPLTILWDGIKELPEMMRDIRRDSCLW